MTKEKTYKDPSGGTFTRATLDRAMNLHMEAGLIAEWHHDEHLVPNASGTLDHPFYHVTRPDGSKTQLANVWHARAFILGLASARYAMEQQLKERDLALEAERARPHGMTSLMDRKYDEYVRSGAFKRATWEDYRAGKETPPEELQGWLE